jgi:hypothetical protein
MRHKLDQLTITVQQKLQTFLEKNEIKQQITVKNENFSTLIDLSGLFFLFL